MSRGFEVRSLAEIAIRCADVGTMLAFYRDVVGLEVLSGDERSDIVFLKVCEGYRGHICVLALFARDAGRPEIHPAGTEPPVTGAGSSLHHLALGVDFEARRLRHRSRGQHRRTGGAGPGLVRAREGIRMRRGRWPSSI